MDGFPKLYAPDEADGPAENKPRDGDVLAFRACGFISALIRRVTCARVTHVGFLVTIRGRKCVLEAREFKGVRLVPLSIYTSDSTCRVDWLRLKDEAYSISRWTVINEAFDHLGQRYASPWQFLRSWGLVSSTLADWLGWPADTDATRFFCSEFVLACLRRAGYAANGHFEPARTAPGDIVELRCLQPMGELDPHTLEPIGAAA